MQQLNKRLSLPNENIILTHRHTGNESAQRNGAKNATHMPRALLSHKVIHKGAERIKEKVLNHHLQDEDLRALRPERVATT